MDQSISASASTTSLQHVPKLFGEHARRPPSAVSFDECVHELFEKNAESSPDAIALVFENQRLTYRELNQRSNQVAHALRKLGVTPETLVGLYMERSLELVIGILAIVKAGGAYMPLDPVYPQERLAFMLDDARPKAILTQQHLRDSLPRNCGVILSLDADREHLSLESKENLHSGVHLDHLAYVIYTSGSTGKPKGTLVTHRNVARLFHATQPWFHFGPDDVWTLFHSHAFDFSVWELWGALVYGGRLVVVPYWVSRSPDAFYKLLITERVTVLNQTPSAFRQLIQAEKVAARNMPMALRFVIFGGEALEMRSLKPWFDRHGDQRPQLVNMYGITETTVHVTYRPLTSADLDSGSVIGIPIPDLKVYILDADRRPVPIGLPGELYVGGAGVTRGYLNRPELTAERFLADPFTPDQGTPLYRTGDVARYLPNRDIEYLGRIDDQVKIRGFRIELGEIESMLTAIPDVREAVVMAREDTPGEKRLVAYVVSSNGTHSVSELRESLRSTLPDYMIPSSFVIMDALPLTCNGKVDRQALPAPAKVSTPLTRSLLLAQNDIECMLIDIWKNLLNLENFGVDEDFFDLGGNSLLAVRFVAEVHRRTGQPLRLEVLYHARTIRDLAAVLGGTDLDLPCSHTVSIQPHGLFPPLFCLPGLGGHAFMFQDLSRSLGFDYPLHVLQFANLAAPPLSTNSIEDIASQCIRNMKTVQEFGPFQLLGYSLGGTIVFEMAQQLHAAGETVSFLGLLDSDGPNYPRTASATARTWMHLRCALRMNHRQRLAYLADRFKGLKRKIIRRPPRLLDAKSPHPAPVSREIESTSAAVYQAWLSYKPRSYAGDITVFSAAAKPNYLGMDFSDPSMGWSPLAERVDVVVVPGSHLDVFKPPHVSTLARRLRENLPVPSTSEPSLVMSA